MEYGGVETVSRYSERVIRWRGSWKGVGDKGGGGRDGYDAVTEEL